MLRFEDVGDSVRKINERVTAIETVLSGFKEAKLLDALANHQLQQQEHTLVAVAPKK